MNDQPSQADVSLKAWARARATRDVLIEECMFLNNENNNAINYEGDLIRSESKRRVELS